MEQKEQKQSPTVNWVEINGNDLTVEDVFNVARNNYKVRLNQFCEQRIKENNECLNKLYQSDKPIYGVNTGFGVFHDKKLDQNQVEELSRNIILSHAIALGEPLSQDVVKAAMLVRTNAFAKAVSGVRLEIVNTLIEMINKNVIPWVPRNGSLASSGDLCLLSHMTLAMTESCYEKDTQDGKAYYEGKLLSGKEAMSAAGIKRVKLGAKEGLAMTNGASFTSAIGCLCVYDAFNLWKASNIGLSLTMEAVKAVPNAFDPKIHNVRKYEGSNEMARHIRMLTKGSHFINQKNRVQDAYSIRCAPAVSGSVYDAIEYARKQLTIEINSATDNPLIFSDVEALSGGNFHGEPIAMVLDLLKIALTELSAISERRTARLVDNTLNNGLPCMLVNESVRAGLNSGLMIVQYSAVSLALKNKTLATPDVLNSLPTSCTTEDHNSNGMNTVLHLLEIVENLANVLAIEIFSATRGMFIRKQMDEKKGDAKSRSFEKQFSPANSKYYDMVMNDKVAPYVAEDYYMHTPVVNIRQLLNNPEVYQMYDSFVKEIKEVQLGIPIGCRDFHPHQMIIREKLISQITKVFKRHGAVTIDTPVFEKREILLGKYGNENKLVYDLEDTGGSLLSMRYDLTVPLARYVAMYGITKMKRYHIAKVYRRDNPSVQTGRYREFVQCDYDLVGDGDEQMQDADVLSVIKEILDEVKIGDYVIKVSHRKLLTDILELCGVPDKLVRTTCSTVDKLDKESWEDVSKELITKGLNEKVVSEIGKYMTLRGKPLDILEKLRGLFKENVKIMQTLNEMETLFKYLTIMKVIDRIEFDLSLARGLDYYTATIFEAVMLEKGISVGSISGGGRYANLIGMFHPQKKQITAVGGSIGIERLFAIMEAREAKEESKKIITETQVMVLPVGKGMELEVMSIAKQLWEAEIKTEFVYKKSVKLNDQLENVAKSNIPYVVLIGNDEKEKGVVKVKDMAARTETVVGRDELVKYLKDKF